LAANTTAWRQSHWSLCMVGRCSSSSNYVRHSCPKNSPWCCCRRQQPGWTIALQA
jgi:hypothetical protein